MKQNLKIIASAICLSVIMLSTGCEKYGCTDKLADNYDSEAEEDDESCVFNSEVVFYSDSARTRELVASGVNASVTILVNDESVGTLNYYNHLNSEPDCDDNFSSSLYEEVVNHTHSMGSNSELISVKIQDQSGNIVASKGVTLEAMSCSAVRI